MSQDNGAGDAMQMKSPITEAYAPEKEMRLHDVTQNNAQGMTPSMSILANLQDIAGNKDLDKNMGASNAKEFRKHVNRVHSSSHSPQELKSSMENLHTWSVEKEKEIKQPFWKKITSIISYGVKSIECLLQGRDQASQQYSTKMSQMKEHLFGKSKSFSDILKNVQGKTSSFVDKARESKKSVNITASR